MNLKQLLANHDREEVLARLFSLYPNQAESAEGYIYVLNSLDTIDPVDSKMVLHVQHCTDSPLDEFDDVYGADGAKNNESEDWPQFAVGLNEEETARLTEFGEKEVTWALDFRPWNEFLGMEIGQETIDGYAETDIIAHCLYEMTFYGYDQESRDQIFAKTKADLSDYDAGKIDAGGCDVEQADEERILPE